MDDIHDRLDYKLPNGEPKPRWCEVCEKPMVKVGFAWVCACGRHTIFASATWRRTYQ